VWFTRVLNHKTQDRMTCSAVRSAGVCVWFTGVLNHKTHDMMTCSAVRSAGVL